MKWSNVGKWIKSNASDGGKLIGSLLAGKVPSAVAAGAAIISRVTGTNDPEEALEKLKQDPELLIQLKKIELEEKVSIQNHIEVMEKYEMESHSITQETIRAGDKADDRFVRWTRPGQSWASLIAAFVYIFLHENPTSEVLLLLLALPWAYAGLRQIGKGVDSISNAIPRKGSS
ncbi:hypothetical protein [Sessilibacter corallicola]|uniref:hypothetical protein n=1 Tax=Sessilibacter corallicola TaxID=2904075 RepID=UPI001E36646E|nr:hypothetical protein [Sessilibacter corallicola]MCE2029275.1 hypothetical protein [Sessilibacter corallicola]